MNTISLSHLETSVSLVFTLHGMERSWGGSQIWPGYIGMCGPKGNREKRTDFDHFGLKYS